MTKLKDELKISSDFQSVEHEVFLSLLVTVDRISRRHNEFMADYNISSKQYNILRILRGAGEGGLPVMEIGRRMIEKSPDVSRIIDRLIDLGYVKRRRQRSDRRVVMVTISQKGLDLLEQMDVPVMKDVRGMLAKLEQKDIQKLTTLLEKVRASVYAWRPEE
jgi:MarR family transcriptional regulator, 2-MHQ and catechol-resistance regulon repressor